MERVYRIIIPAMDNSGHPISTQLLEDGVKQIANHFGGVTVYPVAAGCYTDSAGALECDQNIIVEAVRTDTNTSQVAQDTQWMDGVARGVGQSFGQETIFDQVERDTSTEFVPGQWERSLPEPYRDQRRPTRSTAEVFKDLLP